MARQARDRRRSVLLCVDSLEGRRLLSQGVISVLVPASTHAEIADHDDDLESVNLQTAAAHAVLPIDTISDGNETTKASAGPTRTDTEAVVDLRMESSSREDDAPDSLPTTQFTIVAEPVLLKAISTTTTVENPHTVARSTDLPPNYSTLGNAESSARIVDPTPDSTTSDGTRTIEIPLVPLQNAEKARLVTGDDREAESPSGAGVIARVFPFSSEVLSLAVDQVLERFENLDTLDVFGSVVSQRLATVGIACIAILGSVEIVRRLQPRDSESNRKRTSPFRMVPVLRTAR